MHTNIILDAVSVGKKWKNRIGLFLFVSPFSYYLWYSDIRRLPFYFSKCALKLPLLHVKENFEVISHQICVQPSYITSREHCNDAVQCKQGIDSKSRFFRWLIVLFSIYQRTYQLMCIVSCKSPQSWRQKRLLSQELRMLFLLLTVEEKLFSSCSSYSVMKIASASKKWSDGSFFFTF